MKVTAETIEKLGPFYQERIESAVIAELSRMLQVGAADAMRLYYNSSLAEQIERGAYGIQYLSPQYLAEELVQELRES